MSDLAYLTGAAETEQGPIRSRHIQHPDHAIARDWLLKRLGEIDSLKIETQSFEFEGQTYENIIAKRAGKKRKSAPFIIAAHYDSTANLEPEGTWNPNSDPSPGADDDGSGVVAVLELARLFTQADYRPQHPVWFVLFTAEESGLVGSTAYANALREDGQSVKLMLSLDPIGFNPANQSLIWFSYHAKWSEPADRLKQLALDRAGEMSVLGVDEALIGGDARSDHYPFWQNDYPALHLANFPLSVHYHTMNDTIADVDPGYLKGTTELIADLILDLDTGEQPQATCQKTATLSWPIFLIGMLVLAHRRRPAH